VASPALLQAHARPASPDDLAHFATVAMSAADGRAAWHLRGPGGREFTLQHKPRYTADDLLVLKEAAAAGTGISVLPDYLCRREMREGELVEVLDGWRPPPGIVHAVFPSRRGMVPAVRRFLDFLGGNVTAEGLDCPT
jgi:DNA-binding transcriptional LysR family regulator